MFLLSTSRVESDLLHNGLTKYRLLFRVGYDCTDSYVVWQLILKPEL